MEVIKTLTLPARAVEVDNWLRTHCEANGVWPVAEVTASTDTLVLKFKTRDVPQEQTHTPSS